MTDIVEQLRQPYTDREDIMRSWDALRTYLLDGRTGSYARDIFEIILSNIDEEREQAADEVERLRTALATAEAEIERLTEKAIVGEYMWTPEELDEAVATARKDALERYEQLLDFVVRWTWLHDRSSMMDSERLSAIKYYPPIKDRADAIRALAENTGGDKP
jgi:hypothetical protein